MIFPVLCPVCHADSGTRIVPLSPEVDTFRCGDCHHEWSEPARVASMKPADAELERRWRTVLQEHAR